MSKLEYERDAGLDVLRFLCMLMVAAYHFFNYYGSHLLEYTLSGYRAFFVQNFLWGGGRMACNVFLCISAWYLCDKEFKIERIFKTWLTVFLYSVVIGIVLYSRDRNLEFLFRQLFPISSGRVWYASVYIGLLAAAPFLNILLQEDNRHKIKFFVLCFFVMESVIPTFYPKFSIQLSSLGWFCLLYLMIGIIKLDRIRINRWISLLLFLAGWFICIWFYNRYDFLIQNHAIARLFLEFGFYRSVYFASLASLPCFLSAMGMFLFFKERKIPFIRVGGAKWQTLLPLRLCMCISLRLWKGCNPD